MAMKKDYEDIPGIPPASLLNAPYEPASIRILAMGLIRVA